MEVVKHEENGQVTLVTEVKKVDNRKEKIIVRVSYRITTPNVNLVMRNTKCELHNVNLVM